MVNTEPSGSERHSPYEKPFRIEVVRDGGAVEGREKVAWNQARLCWLSVSDLEERVCVMKEGDSERQKEEDERRCNRVDEV